MVNKAENRYVFIDTETGGIIPEKHNLLSIGLVVWDKNCGIIDSKEWFVKSTEYIVTEKAKEINKFNLEEHQKKSLPGKFVINEILEFVYQYFDKNIAIPLIGHNVQFDINFLKYFMKCENRSFNKHFSHRSIDTYSIFKVLSIVGKIERNIDSSAEAFSYFGIKVSNRHSALGDCLATVELFEKLLKLL